jgi:sugar phosphate isomerase/epimerase
LENHGQYATGQMIKSIVGLIDSPRVAINYNTANVIYFAGVNPLKDMKTCIDKIGYMHIKDKIGGRHEWNFPPLGQGTINFPAILDLLKKADNSCPLSIEIEFTKTGSKDLLEVNRAVKTSYYFLQGLGLKF